MLLVASACFITGENIIDSAIRASNQHRRDLTNVGNSTPAPSTSNGSLPSPVTQEFLEFCAAYKCFCSAAPSGAAWGDNGCEDKCDPKEKDQGKPCHCVWDGCECDDSKVMKSQSKCMVCDAGFVLIDNHCYVESQYPVMFNMILWLGIFAVGALIATSYAIGGMDPGYDSIIYRMTSDRLKAQ